MLSNKHRFIFIFPFSETVGHVSYLEVRPYVNNFLFNDPVLKRFEVGSIDDKFSDMLHTGDVILYSRRWYTHHIPMAILIQLYQFTFDCYFDHMGVVILSPDDGTPYLLELSEFSDKATFRRYDETVLGSQATQINCMRLQPVLQYNENSFAKLEDYMETICRNKDGKNESEFSGLMSFMVKYYCDKIFGTSKDANKNNNKISSSKEGEDAILCPSSKMMFNVYSALGFKKTLVGGDHDPFITVNNFVGSS
jgi:hypothetical protein